MPRVPVAPCSLEEKTVRKQVLPHHVLPSWQASRGVSRPDRVVQFAKFIEEIARVKEGIEDPIVHAYITCSLNGRPSTYIVDPRIDLTEVELSLAHADWILPLEKSLDPGGPEEKKRSIALEKR